MRSWLAAVLMFGCVAGVAQQPLKPGPPVVANEPYTADRVVTSYQKLADGTTIEHKNTFSLARDSQGRGWQQSELPVDPLHPPKEKRYEITVYDPETRTSTRWCTCNKFATVTHYAEPRPLPPEHFAGSEGMDVYLDSGPATQHLKYHGEEMPPQVIQGVMTRGSKAVRTLPAGADGNDKPLTTTIVSWYSPELHLAMTTIIDDPVKGLRKLEFTNLKRVEPDPTLFRLPAGYMIREATPQ